ncbi:hypothetical protein FHW84_004264 [Dyella sp. SG562]|uniref:esterase-like activity of phytase family protein n=1 Tax=Dyella sp. SG562 TaxID=2587017 RepID=UPI0014234415|nr:esterase-like activity of phytase family protein [Dyella sp. SG562]NII75653.1 hypothetical protein [Dyella sp. SG562]
MRTKLAFAVFAAFAAAAPVHAGVELIAAGSLDAHQGDRAMRTARPLENGVQGNLLGGLGSGLAYAGCGSFVALPDRGPNAVSYDSAVDDTSSYIARFHTLRMDLRPAGAGAALPFALTPKLERTTLLWDLFGLYYGDGKAANLPNGAPRENHAFHHYFTGRSDNADPARNSGWPLNGRLDPEGIRVSADGDAVFVSDEYGPYVYKFDRRSGRRLDSYALPAHFYVAKTASHGADEIAGNTSGRVANKGMEGLAISPDGRVLFGAMQAPLIQDGGDGAPVLRIARIDLRTRQVREYAYPLTNSGTPAKPKYNGVSEILAVNDHQLLVDERDGKGFGDGSEAKFKRVYLIDLDGAADVGKLSGAAALAAVAVQKTPFLDVVAELGRHGMLPSEIPAKLEGLSFGPDVTQDGRRRHTLFIANDNDFLATVTDDLHPQGADNPNRFFVFAFDDADLPGLKPQRIEHERCDAR